MLVGPDGLVAEGGASSFFVVIEGTVVTRPNGRSILPGVTRGAVVAVAAELGIDVDERLFSLDDLGAATEAFITGASSYVQPVTKVDDLVIGDGKPGPRTLSLREAYLDYARRSFYRP